MRIRRPSPAADSNATAVRRRPSIEVSGTGATYIAMMLFMGLAAMNSQANLLFGVFGLMIGILLVSGVISRVMLTRLELHRGLPELAVVGEPTTVSYEFRNVKRFWPSLSIVLYELEGSDAFARQPTPYLLHAAPGQTTIVPAQVVPRRRGLHVLSGFQLGTSFPFGFIRRAVARRQPQDVLIYPAIGQVDPKVLRMCRPTGTSGSTVRPRRGGMDEFYGVKEYRAGENPRWIHWKRSARTGALVVREMTQASPPKLVLLVDNHHEPGVPPGEACERVERAIAMAASLASGALESGLSVGMFAWSGDWVSLPPNRGKRHRRDLLALLACLPNGGGPGQKALLDHAQGVLKSGVTPVLLTPRDSEQGLAEAARGGMVVLSANSPQARGWFRFGPGVDFARCAPRPD